MPLSNYSDKKEKEEQEEPGSNWGVITVQILDHPVRQTCERSPTRNEQDIRPFFMNVPGRISNLESDLLVTKNWTSISDIRPDI